MSKSITRNAVERVFILLPLSHTSFEKIVIELIFYKSFYFGECVRSH